MNRYSPKAPRNGGAMNCAKVTILEMKFGTQAATLFPFLDTMTDLDTWDRITRSCLQPIPRGSKR
ncbi:MAG TPA: hypothetical protein VN379_18530 [Sporomusa sp.]|nr:hypothetical protein [Sporomusa sp.]